MLAVCQPLRVLHVWIKHGPPLLFWMVTNGPEIPLKSKQSLLVQNVLTRFLFVVWFGNTSGFIVKFFIQWACVDKNKFVQKIKSTNNFFFFFFFMNCNEVFPHYDFDCSHFYSANISTNAKTDQEANSSPNFKANSSWYVFLGREILSPTSQMSFPLLSFLLKSVFMFGKDCMFFFFLKKHQVFKIIWIFMCEYFKYIRCCFFAETILDGIYLGWSHHFKFERKTPVIVQDSHVGSKTRVGVVFPFSWVPFQTGGNSMQLLSVKSFIPYFWLIVYFSAYFWFIFSIFVCPNYKPSFHWCFKTVDLEYLFFL